MSIERNRAAGIVPRESRFETLQDLYSDNDRFTVTNKDRNEAAKAYRELESWQQRVFDRAIEENALFYFLDFENKGGVPSPILMDIHYQDGSNRFLELPAEIWRKDAERVTHRLIENKPIAFIEIDKQHQTADTDYSNNRFPPSIHSSRLQLYKSKRKTRNLMADLLVELKAKQDAADQPSENLPLEQADAQ